MKRLLIPVLALIALSASCARQEYDISEGVNKEVTLFENVISAPIGGLSTITIGSTLNGLSQVDGLGGMVAQYIKVAEDGALVLEDEGDIFRINVYELENRIGDVSAPQTWSAGYQSAYTGGMAPLLGYLGMKTVNQKVVVSAANPLNVDVPARCGATVTAMGSTLYSAPVTELDALTLQKRKTAEVATVNVAPEVEDPLSLITFSDLQFDLPANPSANIADNTGNLFFAFTYNYTCGAAVGPAFSMPLTDISTGDINLTIGKYKVQKCVLKAEIENTVPIAVRLDSVMVIKPKADESDPDVVDENIHVSSGAVVAGGSLENPATSAIEITIEALDGTVPDIPELHLNLTLSGQPGLADTALKADQGITVKSVSAILYGGITIPED